MGLLCAPLGAITTAGSLPETIQITRIVDGDSFEFGGKTGLRIVGINTPEWDEPGGREAKRAVTEKLAKAATVQLERCLLRQRDRYDRVLGFVSVDGRDLGSELLREGLAVPLALGKCGEIRAQAYEADAASARRGATGLWKSIMKDPLAAEEAAAALNKYRGVHGKIRTVHVGKAAIHFNFGKDWRTDFSVFIKKRDWPAFERAGLDWERDFAGKTVTVYGWVRSHHGPQIELFSPEQLVWDKRGSHADH